VVSTFYTSNVGVACDGFQDASPSVGHNSTQ